LDGITCSHTWRTKFFNEIDRKFHEVIALFLKVTEMKKMPPIFC
jgi:hypothetical protein